MSIDGEGGDDIDGDGDGDNDAAATPDFDYNDVDEDDHGNDNDDDDQTIGSPKTKNQKWLRAPGSRKLVRSPLPIYLWYLEEKRVFLSFFKFFGLISPSLKKKLFF